MVTGTAEERLQHALDLAYRYLGRRDRTVLEVRRHLEGKIYDALGLGDQDLVQPIEHEEGAAVPEIAAV